MMPLGLLAVGESAEIMEIRTTKATSQNGCSDEKGKSDCRIEDMGIRVGRIVEMLNNGGSSILLKVGESRLALGRSLAMKIMIREV
jgi:ferrous iron transport protein A